MGSLSSERRRTSTSKQKDEQLAQKSAIRRSDLARIQLQSKTDHFHAGFCQLSQPRTIVRHWAPKWEVHVRHPPCWAKMMPRVAQFRGLSKMTLSSSQAQAPRVILSGFSPSNCTEKSKRKPARQTCQLRAP